MEEKGIFKDFQSEIPKINGSTTINHEIRAKLGITADEYCFMMYLEDRKRKDREFDLSHCFSVIGYSPDTLKLLFNSLVKHELLGLFRPGEVPIITEKWEILTDVDAEFNMFWYEPLPDGKRKAAWKGSKPQAKKLFEDLRKKCSLDYILRQRNHYFHYLRLTKKYRSFDQARMMATVWLNLKNERWKEDWKLYCEDLEETYNPRKPIAEAVTMDKVQKAFEK